MNSSDLTPSGPARFWHAIRLNWVFVAFLVSEIGYIGSVRLLVYGYTGSVLSQELYWSGIRLASIVILWWLLRRGCVANGGRRASFSARHLVAAGCLLVPIVVGKAGLNGIDRFVFAATSFLVGLREELAYRAILQRFLLRRFGLIVSLLISNVAFVGYHYGVQSFALTNVLFLFLMGTILGYVYYLSGSILLVVLLHSIHDAIWSFTPLIARPMPEFVSPVILLITLVALVVANRRPAAAPGSVAGRQTDNV